MCIGTVFEQRRKRGGRGGEEKEGEEGGRRKRGRSRGRKRRGEKTRGVRGG